MKVFVGAVQEAVYLKEKLVDWMKENEFDVVDVTTF